MGFEAGLLAFTAAVVGGIGSLPGAVLGGLLIGLAEAFATGLPLVDLPARDRVRDPDRGDARAPERALRARGGAEGLMRRRRGHRRPARPEPGRAAHRRRRVGRVARGPARGRRGPRRPAPERARAHPAAARSSRRSASPRRLVPLLTNNDYVDPRRLRHAALHAARARPEHRRRLRGAARPRLRRVLRLRRVRLRDARVARSSACTGRRSRSSRWS